MRPRLSKEMTDEEWEQVQKDMDEMEREERAIILVCQKHGEYNKHEGCLECMAEWFENQNAMSAGLTDWTETDGVHVRTWRVTGKNAAEVRQVGAGFCGYVRLGNGRNMLELDALSVELAKAICDFALAYE